MSVPDAEAAALLRDLARDVSHELRGPVQSILVNLEVLRRRAQNADTAALLERADIIEEEIQRMHHLADSFFSLLRAHEADSGVVEAEALLAVLDPITAVRAKSARLKLDRPRADASLLLRVPREAVLLAVLRLFLGLCETLTAGDSLTLSAAAEPDAVLIRLESQSAQVPGTALLLEALRAASGWLEAAGGTASLEPGSDTRRIALTVRLPRAVLTVTSNGA